MVRSEVLKILFLHFFRFLIFHLFFQGVSGPHLPLYADAHEISSEPVLSARDKRTAGLVVSRVEAQKLASYVRCELYSCDCPH